MRRPAALSLIALALASAASCGLASHETSSKPVPTDGLGAFGDFQPIELCRGTARVVAPIEATGSGAAVCIREEAAQRSCSSDAECSFPERCTCGRCIVRACQGAASCGEGEVCRAKRCTHACSSDAACAAGERCISGGCSRACSSDAACHFGEQCDAIDGACAARLCSATVKCGIGDRCEPEEAVGEVHGPDIVAFAEKPIAFVEIREGAGAGATRAIYRVRIDAANRWTADPADPVVTADDEGGAGAPSAIVDGELVELYFELGGGAAIGHAVSKDGGKSFAEDPDPVLVPTSAWEAGRVAAPAVFDYRGARYLAYEIGARAGVGLARLDASGPVRLGDGPIATTATFEDPLFWRGITEVGAPYVVIAPEEPGKGEGAGAPNTDGVIRIYLTVRGAEGSDAKSADGPLPADRNDSIGLLTSTDLASWDRFPTGPVFARVVNLRGYLGEREPVVRLRPSGAEITFVAADASGENVTGLARSGGPL